MNILYLVFGQRISDHLQAHLSIRTFMHQLTSDETIYVVTTNPEYYNRLESVKIITIHTNTLKEWEGTHGFFWRVKIKAIEHVANICPTKHLLYLDSDTVLTGSLDKLNDMLDNGCGIMHLDEGHPSKMKAKSLKMWKRVAGHTYGGVTLGLQHDMWNAGVVGIPSEKLCEVIPLALQLCDGMLDDNAERVVIEQYSLSIALYERTYLSPAYNHIAHYWGNKNGWNRIAEDFFIKSYMTGLSVDEEYRTIQNNLKEIPLHVKRPKIQLWLTNLICKIFPDRIVKN